MANSSRATATMLAAIKHEPLQPPPFLPPPIPIPPPLATVKTEESQLLKSINDLASHASAILAFKSRFDELTKHLEFINLAIDSKFNEPLPQIEPKPCLKSTQTEAETVQKGPKTAPPPPPPPQPSCGGIQSHCMRMNGKQVRKYMAKHLSNLPVLREEVTAALKLAPEPAKLVLDSIGEIFLMGKNAYTKVPSLSQARQAILLLLELFLLMMSGDSGVRIAAKVKLEAQNRAVAWRKRLNKEGGLGEASEADARGLLLYVACFGIPKVFLNEDLGILLKLCNLSSISDAIKASPWLPGKIPDLVVPLPCNLKAMALTEKVEFPRESSMRSREAQASLPNGRTLLFATDIIESMAKNGMHFEAMDVASIFGLEDKFSPKRILTLFLQESTKAFERQKREAYNSPAVLRKVNEKRLGALKSVVHCLEDPTKHSDATELLGSWLLKEKIVKLEEEIAEPVKRIVKKNTKPKRKPDEMGSSSMIKSQEIKRARFDTKEPPVPESHVNQLREQPTAILAEGDGLVPHSCNANNYPVASSAPNGSTCSLPGNGSGQMGGTTGVESSGIGVIPASSYSGEDGEIEVDNADQMMSDGWPKLSDVQSASAWFVGLFGSSLSVEGFVGLPDNSVRTIADLYRFADV
ncbi:hypothetical protein V6N13_030746 [Hibiscus sabdariffa]|uniref:FRIGIDA-like protein n=1 Tax=Hibiscus sabdariffa TaxID=183260 RepID=A0ABR2D650_9ROSI